MPNIPSVETLEQQLTPLVGLCWRVVETQETAATRAITKNAEEQLRLEQLLDSSKPPLPEGCESLSYLLATPFRYPPLQYGSRYGSEWEQGIFYAANHKKTALIEAAVYLWLFQQGPETIGELAEIKDSRTLFSIRLKSQKGCNLCTGVFSDIREVLTYSDSWRFTQELGSHLRQAGADFFWYPSARDVDGINTAVLSPKAFVGKKPDTQELWHLHLTKELCWFGRGDGRYFEFSREEFEQQGLMKHPCL